MNFQIDPFTVSQDKLGNVLAAVASITGEVPKATLIPGDAKLNGNGHDTGSTYDQFRSAMMNPGYSDTITSHGIHEWIASKGKSASQYSYLTSKAKGEGWLRPTRKRGNFKIKR